MAAYFLLILNWEMVLGYPLGDGLVLATSENYLIKNRREGGRALIDA